MPFCMFTDPELARVGRNETEAKRDKIEYRVAKLPMANALRTPAVCPVSFVRSVDRRVRITRRAVFTRSKPGA